MKLRFYLPFQLFSWCLFCDSERQIPHSRKSITVTPIWIRGHWWSALSNSSSLYFASCWRTEIFWGREFCFKRDDYFCVNLCWVLQHRVKQRTQRGCAACERKSRDTEGLCKIKGVGAYKVAHLTHSIAGPFWCHADITTPWPHLPYT